MRSPFAWPGGKSALLPTLLAALPPHQLYVEVFSGSAKLLFAKDPAPHEILNDLNGEVTNFFRVAKHRAAELAERLELECIHARRFKQLRSESAPLDELERALRFAYLTWHSFGAKGQHFAHPTLKGLRVKHSLDSVRELLRATAKRLSNVCIEELDFMEILDRYDSAETFFYLDPPYTQYCANGRYEAMTPERRAELFARLAKLKASFLLSFDDCEEIRELAARHGLKLKPVSVLYTLGGAHRTKGPSGEVLISGRSCS